MSRHGVWYARRRYLIVPIDAKVHKSAGTTPLASIELKSGEQSQAESKMTGLSGYRLLIVVNLGGGDAGYSVS
jgi:hypothetical protein